MKRWGLISLRGVCPTYRNWVIFVASGPFRAELTFIQMLSMRCVFGWTALKNLLGQSEPARLFLLAGLLTVWQVTREHNVGRGEEFIYSVSQRQSRMTVNGSSAQTLSTIQTKMSNSRLIIAYMTMCRRKTLCCESFPNVTQQV